MCIQVGDEMPSILTHLGKEIIVFAPMYGTKSLRENNNFIVNIRGSYYDEISALVEYLKSNGTVCFVTENSGVGNDMANTFREIQDKEDEYTRILAPGPDGGCLSLFLIHLFLFFLLLLHPLCCLCCSIVMLMDLSSQLYGCKSVICVISEKNIVSFVEYLRRPFMGDLINVTLAFTSFTDPAFLLPQLNNSDISPDNLIFSTVVPPGREDEINRTISQFFPAHNFSYYAAEGYYAGRLFTNGLFLSPFFNSMMFGTSTRFLFFFFFLLTKQCTRLPSRKRQIM